MTGTFSKSPLAWGFEPDLHITQAAGSRVGLSDGKHYLDWVSGLGTNLYGYGHFTNEITNELQGGGGSHSLPHKLEYEAAELLADMLTKYIPYWNFDQVQVRFCLSGTDAVSMAIRLARYITESDGIICLSGGYHGWADWTICRTEPADGVPESIGDDIREFKFNDIADLERVGSQMANIAAVVIEQPLEKPSATFYDEVRDFCDNNGALLIIDEVVTGLRYGLGGISSLYDIDADLICMGKALGNGLPVAAVCGSADWLSKFSAMSPPFCSSTHWGNSLNMAAAKAVLKNWDEKKVNYINHIGKLLMDSLAAAGWEIVGDPVRSLLLFGQPEERAFFIQGMREEGILMNRPNFPTMAHSERDVDYTFEAAVRVRAKFKIAIERGVLSKHTEGKLPRILFSER
jgi:glutamate-1-semialdehyde aminotransferase